MPHFDATARSSSKFPGTSKQGVAVTCRAVNATPNNQLVSRPPCYLASVPKPHFEQIPVAVAKEVFAVEPCDTEINDEEKTKASDARRCRAIGLPCSPARDRHDRGEEARTEAPATLGAAVPGGAMERERAEGCNEGEMSETEAGLMLAVGCATFGSFFRQGRDGQLVQGFIEDQFKAAERGSDRPVSAEGPRHRGGSRSQAGHFHGIAVTSARWTAAVSGAMPIFERPTSRTVEMVPAFTRLDAVQDRLTTDECYVTVRAMQQRRGRVRGGREHGAGADVSSVPTVREDTMIVPLTLRGAFRQRSLSAIGPRAGAPHRSSTPRTI